MTKNYVCYDKELIKSLINDEDFKKKCDNYLAYLLDLELRNRLAEKNISYPQFKDCIQELCDVSREEEGECVQGFVSFFIHCQIDSDKLWHLANKYSNLNDVDMDASFLISYLKKIDKLKDILESKLYI